MNDTVPGRRVGLGELFGAFFALGASSFGGGVVAYLREALVTRRAWLDDDDFLAALELSQTLPGLNATNMSVIVGDRLRGTTGAALAFLGMTLPGTVVVFVLGVLYGVHGHRPVVTAVLGGIAAAAVGMLLAVTLQIGRKEVSGNRDLLILLATFIAIGTFHVRLLVVLLTIGPLSIWLYRPRPPVGGS
jgi:chromate transporter